MWTRRGLDVVFCVEVVAAQHDGLQHVDTADCKPAERGDHGHDEDLANEVFPSCRGSPGTDWKNEEEAGEEEDGRVRVCRGSAEDPIRCFGSVLPCGRSTRNIT